jgi:hypothetical protein
MKIGNEKNIGLKSAMKIFLKLMNFIQIDDSKLALFDEKTPSLIKLTDCKLFKKVAMTT